MSVLFSVYHAGAVRVSELIGQVGGHPATVIDTLRVLESVRIVSRTRLVRDRRTIEVRLTLQGLELMETAMSRWGRVLRKWDTLR